MKKYLLLYFFLFIITFASSCMAFYSGTMSSSAGLSAPNFSYVKKNISGQSRAIYILVFGGMEKQNLVEEAKQKMLSKNPLQNNQALTNITVSFKKVINLFYRKVTCTITADVVEFKTPA